MCRHGVVIGSTLDLYCVSSLSHLAMLVVPDAKIQIDKICAWKQSHDGELPKRRSTDSTEENRLAVLLHKLKLRRSRPLGAKPSERQLSTEEVAYLNECLSPVVPGLCQTDTGSITSEQTNSVPPAVQIGPSDSAAPGLCHDAAGITAASLSSHALASPSKRHL